MKGLQEHWNAGAGEAEEELVWGWRRGGAAWGTGGMPGIEMMARMLGW